MNLNGVIEIFRHHLLVFPGMRQIALVIYLGIYLTHNIKQRRRKDIIDGKKKNEGREAFHDEEFDMKVNEIICRRKPDISIVKI
jgi:hypothetical protein